MKNKKVILDTNLWISFLITHKLDFLDMLISSKKVKFVFSQELIEEFIDVAKRPKFERYFSTSDIKDLLRLFDEYGKLVEVKTNVQHCRDTKDDFLLNLAIDGKVDYLVTGDKDVLVLEKVKKTRIVTLARFTELISG